MNYDKFGTFLKNGGLDRYSGFKVGGKAEFLFVPNSSNDLVNFLKLNKFKKINIIGCGYNTLIRDGITTGVTMVTKNINKIELHGNSIKVGSGTLNSSLFNFTKKHGIDGFEFLGCIPGTVGGACIMNAGCYGSEVKDIIKSIDAVDFDGNLVRLYGKDCGFGYRFSLIPKNLILLSATFDASNRLDMNAINDRFRVMLEKKTSSQPIAEKTCGSTFKNLDGIPAWKVIQDIGFQGIDFGGIKFSEKHANFLINFNNNSSRKIEEVIRNAQKKAKELFNIDLELEIKILGE